MESGTNIFRYLFLVLLLTVSFVKAEALSVCSEVNIESVYLQPKTVVKNLTGIPDTNNVRKNVTPVVILTLLPYQGQIAQLSWTIDPTLPGTFYVERFDAIYGWVVVKQLPYDASPVFFYNDTISSPYCTATNFTYQIRFISALDNVTSSAESASLSDLSAPANVQNLNVSITPNRFPVLSWTSPFTGDSISGYMIQRDNGFSWDSITTLSPGSNQFIDNSVPDVCDKSYRYIVVTIDGCQIPSAPVYEKEYVQTLKFASSQPGQCDRFSELTWNSYINMPGGLGGYKIYRNDGSTTVEIMDTKDTAYTDKFHFKDGSTYTYSLTAYSADSVYSSSSCLIGWPYNGFILPDSVYITQVTVEADSYIKVGYHFSPAGTVVKLILERSDNGGTSFHAIDSLPDIGVFVPDNSFFTDTTVNVFAQSYYYRLVAIDEYCGSRTPSLNTSQSIWLQCATSETQNSLEWNKYEYWLKGVKGYDIYRTLSGDPATVKLLDNVDQNTVTFTELLSDYDNTKPTCYWVEGIENPGNLLNNVISISNSCCIFKEPILYIPNAFHPDGINKRFRPVPKPFYVDAQTFKMTIFSRWGQQIFETSDMVNGWDGTINGQATSAGQYSYLLTYKSPEGKEYKKRGTVLLVR